MPKLAKRQPSCRSLQPPVILPDGKKFETWDIDQPHQYERTLHVDNGNVDASDDNPGTSHLPFRSINAAAQAALPGDVVLIHSGIYRERVAPIRGGDGPDQLIHFEAAPGADVTVKGSIIAPPRWKLSQFGANIWKLGVDHSWFDEGYNPFDLENVTAAQFNSMDWALPERENPLFSLPRALVFQDGMRMSQVVDTERLCSLEGSYWIDRIQGEIYVHPFGDGVPSTAMFELAVRETVFAPRVENLGYIRVCGLTIEHAAGPWPFPQVGAISTTRGHHWIIERNTVQQVNAVGIDIGRQRLEDYAMEYGFHIVRHNRITDCGICGINGFGPGDGDVEFGLLVENNIIERIGFHAAENLHECGGIKLHCCNRCLIRRNLVTDTIQGPGIWIDAYNAYTRCCENVILNSNGRCGLFFEISFKPNLVDSNVIWSAAECGILEADGRGQTFAHNFIGECREGIELRGRQTDRIAAEDCGEHSVLNNIIIRCGIPILQKSFRPSELAGNFIDGVEAMLLRDPLTLTWSNPSNQHGVREIIPTITHDIFQRPRTANAGPGPFGELPVTNRTYDLTMIVSPDPKE